MKAFDYNQTYSHTLVELKCLIENEFGSVLNFCNVSKIDRPNLVRTFSRFNGKDMSVGLFVRCAVALGLMVDDNANGEEAQLLNLTLRNYLKIDAIAVWSSMFKFAGHKSGDDYLDTMVGLKAAILTKFGSMKAFCDACGFDRPNLVKVFSDNSDRELSVGLYIRIASALGVIKKQSIDDSEAQLINLSLRNFIKVDAMSIWRTILTVSY